MQTNTQPIARKADFVEAYRSEVRTRYPWAKDEDKLHRFMVGCITTLDGGSEWNHQGDAVTAAWRSIGGRGAPTLKALRALL